MADLVDLALAKAHLRKLDTTEDTLIEGYIDSAREWVEDYLGVYFEPTETTRTFAAWGDFISIFPRPLTEVGGIAYTDTGGEEAAFEDFTLATGLYPARIYPITAFPDLGTNGTVTVTLTAGYAASEIPAQLIQAQLVLIAGMYENRGGLSEDTIRAAKALCNKTPGLA